MYRRVGHGTAAPVVLVLLVPSCAALPDQEGGPPADLPMVAVVERAAPEVATADAGLPDCKDDPRVSLGLVSGEVCRGAQLFFRETFGGNGRTCGTCHPVANNYTVDAPFIAALPPTDPLFVSAQRPELAGLEHLDLLKRFGLFTVNADGFDDPSRFVLRSTPHTLSLATSIAIEPYEAGLAVDGTPVAPNHRLGWGGDGSPSHGELRDFADGAIKQHATRSLARVVGTDFTLPTDAQRDAIAAFMMTLGRTNELDLNKLKLSDPAAERGRVSFLTGPAKECGDCHHNAGANTSFTDDRTGKTSLLNLTLDVGTEQARLPELDEAGIPKDDGFGIRVGPKTDLTSPPGNFSFNTPPLIEAADTAPFFHTNASETIEDAIDFYTREEFAHSLTGVSPTEARPKGGAFKLNHEQVSDLGRFLRVLNAALNCQMASARVRAALRVSSSNAPSASLINARLAMLAREEVVDALTTLSKVPALNVIAQARLRHADEALRTQRPDDPKTAAELTAILQLIEEANRRLGTGIDYVIGEGTLMF